MIRRVLAALVACIAPLAGPAVAQTYVAPSWVIPYPDDLAVYDYRPDINAAGTRIVFERSFIDKDKGTLGPTNLYVADIGSSQATRLVSNVSPTTRPDWCWRPGRPNVEGPIAFTRGEFGPIYVVEPKAGVAGPPINYTGRTIYPTWFPGCGALALDAINALAAHPASESPALLGPTTLKVVPPRGLAVKSLTGPKLWAGFPSVNSVNPALVAFAGQQFALNGKAPCDKAGYDQNCNYIYIAIDGEGGPRVFPLDPNAPTNIYDPTYQGRAPTWSPDAGWIAFESNRTCTDDLSNYAIFLQDWPGRHPARQVTECRYNAQHAKWYRRPVDGKTLLIVSALRYPGEPSHALARVIASLDVSAFVAPSR